MERIYAEGRYRQSGGDYALTPWTGTFGNYQRRDGLLIPTEGEVAWNLPEGELAYFRGRLEEIEYGTAE